jgi:hypothetical protein
MLEHREGGCHCGRVRFRARVDLDLLSQCSCTVCTKKGILHVPVAPENFELLRGKNSLSTYTFGTGVAQHTFCLHCGCTRFTYRVPNPTELQSTPGASTISTGRASNALAFSMAVTGRKLSANGLPKEDTSPLPD